MNEQSIFLASLDIVDPAKRAEFLAQTCAGNPALRQQVEALLAAHERSGQFLEIPAIRQVSSQPPSPAASDRSSGPGDETSAEQGREGGEIDLSFLNRSTKPGSLGRIGHYEVEEVLGRGGCGIVLRAFDEMLHRTVAIKVMAVELAATSPARKRFLREARAAAAVRHANVVNIYSVEDRPIPFLVMEYIPGQTLQQRINETGPLNIREVADIGQQIASGLDAAHSMGLIHRDIKPGNILLEKGTNQVKITDFGLARTGDDASVTQSGVIAGTPLYMSPEQAQGATIDQRSDLFSLGSVLYVMCSGRPPFRAATTLAVLKRVAESEPRPIREIIPETPEWMTAIIAKLHSKAPSDRFQSAQEVAQLLKRRLLDLPLSDRLALELGECPPVHPPEMAASLAVASAPAKADECQIPARKERPTQRRPGPWLALAAMVTLIAGLGFSEASGVTNVGGTVIRLFSPSGTLVVRIDDPDVSVRIDGEEIVITGAGAKEIRLKPGLYQVVASKDGKVVRKELITVTNHGRQAVRIGLEVEPVRDSSSPPADSITEFVPNRPTAASADAPEAPTDPDRSGAEYVLSLGGTVRVNDLDVDIRAAAGLPKEPFRLTSIDLTGNPKVSNEGLAACSGCTDIKDLWLGTTPVGDEGLAHFQHCKQIKTLDLGSTKVTNAGLAHLKGNKLTHLWLYFADQVGDEGLASFQGSTDIVHLQLNVTQVSDRGLANFKDGEKLMDLNVYYTQVADEGMSYFKKCKDLRSLCIGQTKVTEQGLSHFRGCKKLTGLNLNGLPIGEAGLANFVECTAISAVALHGTRVNDAALGVLPALPDLFLLDLGATQITDAGLKRFESCTKLQTLSLPNTQVTDEGLACFRNSRMLTRLELYGTQISDAGLAHFRNHRQLTLLNLGISQITGAGLSHFASSTNLSELYLFQSQVGDEGVAVIENWTNLTTLHLGETKISDLTLAHLKQTGNLVNLDLRGANVTDKGLEELRECKSLRTLEVSKTQVTVQGIDMLAKALPGCQILWDGGVIEPR